MLTRAREEMKKKGVRVLMQRFALRGNRDPAQGCRTGIVSFDVDLFVIGAGSGGVRAARIAAGYGARVMVAEEFRIGGTCVIRGCVPKKLLVYASRFADDFADAAGYGWSVGETRFDWPTMVAAKEKEITRLSASTAPISRRPASR